MPDDVTIQMVRERIAEPDCGEGIIFDGFPRTRQQAEALDAVMAELGRETDSVVYIKVEERELLTRLGGRWICQSCQTPYHAVASPPRQAGVCDKCGGELYQRADDRPETVQERLKVYFDQTAPLIDYYREAGKLLEVDGTGSVDEVREKILVSLKVGYTGRRGGE